MSVERYFAQNSLYELIADLKTGAFIYYSRLKRSSKPEIGEYGRSKKRVSVLLKLLPSPHFRETLNLSQGDLIELVSQCEVVQEIVQLEESLTEARRKKISLEREIARKAKTSLKR